MGLLSRMAAAAVHSTTPNDRAAPAERTPALPAEEIRLDTKEFREGLKKRGLTEILEQHVRDFPPAGGAASALALREVKLAEAADPKRPRDEKLAAFAEANEILELLLVQEKADPRRFEWRFTLAHSLIYDEGEPYSTNVLYRGGGRDDREQLRPRTERATAQVNTLTEELAAEARRLDGLAVGEFERLERAGYVEQIDRLSPRTDYLRLWTLFYDALAREEADPIRVQHLREIKEALGGNSPYVTTPHATSRIQVQSLLLSGMTHRRLDDTTTARQQLERASTTAERLGDQAEQKRVEWAVQLAWIERIRNESDAERFDEAISLLKKFRAAYSLGGDDARALTVVAALLERSVHRARAGAAERAGRSGDALRHADEAWLALLQLARRDDGYRDELYTIVFDLTDSDVNLPSLDPFEQCALVAGLLARAHRRPEQATALLERAVDLGDRFASAAADTSRALAPELLPELQYNVAVALYRLGRFTEAAGRFLRVAQQHPGFRNARKAAVLAVQLAGELYGNPSLKTDPGVRRLYREGLHTLLTDYAGSEEAREYRLRYARLLDEWGEYDLAAVQYAAVTPDHPRFTESAFHRVRCLALALERQAREHPQEALELRRRLNDFLTIQREFVVHATGLLSRRPEDGSTPAARTYLATAKILLAEVQILPPVDRASHAIETLENWEAEFPDDRPLLGRVWRVRLLAYEKLGRLDAALQALPAYIAADPEGAGATLQSLYALIFVDIENLRAAGETTAAQRKADAALTIAQQLADWATRADQRGPAVDRRAVDLQLAEANLNAGRFDRAKDLFLSVVPGLAASPPMLDGVDPRITYGYAESLLQLREYEKALLPLRHLATVLQPTDRLRWKSLLGDLRCRTALHQPPDGIIKVIQQQRFLYPDLGGPALAPQFQQLLRENEHRKAGG